MERIEYRAFDENCYDCRYFGGKAENAWCCNYIFIAGQRRPCPPGDGCTVKLPGPRKVPTYRHGASVAPPAPVKKEKTETAVCPICKRVFVKGGKGRTYCGAACTEDARLLRQLKKNKY